MRKENWGTVGCRALLGLLLAFALAPARASILVTQAWHLVLPNSRDTGGSNPLVLDTSGNAYFTYVTNGALHLRKMSPAVDPYFDINVGTLPGSLQSIAPLTITQKISGKQFLLIGFTSKDLNGNNVINLVKYDTAGVAQWGNPFNFTNATGGDALLAVATDSSGNIYLAVADTTLTNTQFKMLKVVPNAASFTQTTVTEITPQGMPFFDIPTNSWFVAGKDNTVTTDARWGSYNASTGVRNFGGTFSVPSGFDLVQAQVVPLPGSEVAIIRNIVQTSTATPLFNFSVISTTGSNLWHYPSSGSEFGMLKDMQGSMPNLPIYGIGTYPSNGNTLNFIDQFSTNGTRNWRRNSAPASEIFPTIDGFWSAWVNTTSSTLYIEHADANAAFDYGKQYPNFIGSTIGFGTFQNAVYAEGMQSGPQVFLDRFVTGPTLKSISAPSVTPMNTQFTLTVTLNAPAPAGGIKVGLSSFDQAVKFHANGTTSLVVNVPPGQSSLTVLMDAGTVTTNDLVHLLGISDGVRANTSITVTTGP